MSLKEDAVISTMAKVIILIALSNMLTLVSPVRVVHAPGTRDDKKLKEVEVEPRHFPHSSVTKHTSAHTRLPQKGVFGESLQVKYHHHLYWPLDYPVSSVTNSLYELKFAKIQAGYERTFCKNTYVTWVKIRALTVKYSIFQKWQELLF